MQFKRIYIEITNVCNMHCSFCVPHKRENRFMTLDEFNHILDEISSYSKYIYLHVKGEPLFHPRINEFVKCAYDRGFEINLTTNGTLLEEHLDITKYLRQINLSLHATNSLNIIKTIKQINDCIVCIRLWRINKDDSMIKVLEQEFNTSISASQNFTLRDNIFLSQMEEFEWPDINSEKEEVNGYCHALKDQLAILVDGTVVPCCLDNNGDIALGNIFKNHLNDILENEKTQNIINGFKNRVAVEPLCKKCTFKNRF